jgi:serine/threonine protein kinase
VSLQKVLLDAHTTDPQHDLSARLALMRKMASCIFFVHTANHVHKSIRTSNILLLSSDLPNYLGEPYLVGFDLSRKSQQASGYTRTKNWWDAYYLPPDRQGDTNRAYTMLDDIYSFGVVLLELCLWRSFARRRKSSKPPHDEKWVRGLDMQDLSDPQQSKVLGPEELRQKFLELAKKHVPVVMGSIMSELIMTCLSCAENGGAFGKRAELEDKDGIVMGIAYTRQVILRLESVAL